jgi:hypothetical protein
MTSESRGSSQVDGCSRGRRRRLLSCKSGEGQQRSDFLGLVRGKEGRGPLKGKLEPPFETLRQGRRVGLGDGRTDLGSLEWAGERDRPRAASEVEEALRRWREDKEESEESACRGHAWAV